MHVDRWSGAIVGRADWSDYGLGARAMSTAIPLHQGSLGSWNVVASAAVCVAVLVLAFTGPLAWWLRRPARSGRLAAPPRVEPGRVPIAAWLAVLVLGLSFPLAGAAIASLWLLDRLLLASLPALRARLD